MNINTSIVTIRLPGRDKTISTPAFLSRLIICLNRTYLRTQSVKLEDDVVSILFEDYDKVLEWINGLRTLKHSTMYNFIKDETSLMVSLPEFGSQRKLTATWIFHKSKAIYLNTVIYKLLREK
jgi:hypothetical protein